jgi:hypothetical protein
MIRTEDNIKYYSYEKQSTGDIVLNFTVSDLINEDYFRILTLTSFPNIVVINPLVPQESINVQI